MQCGSVSHCSSPGRRRLRGIDLRARRLTSSHTGTATSCRCSAALWGRRQGLVAGVDGAVAVWGARRAGLHERAGHQEPHPGPDGQGELLSDGSTAACLPRLQ